MSDNRTKSLPNANKVNVSNDEISDALSFTSEFMTLEPVRKREPKKVKERLDLFFKECSEYGRMPTVELMCVALGVSRQSLNEWQHEGCEAGEMVTRAKTVINALLTEFTIQGKNNPIFTIWLQKNHYGYVDAKQIDIAPTKAGIQADQTPEEIAKKLEQDIPIDTEYSENDD